MAIDVRHQFNSQKSDNSTAQAQGKVLPSHWNAGHNITMASGNVIGRVSAGNGAIEEIPLVTTSAGAGDAGKIPRLNSSGQIDSSMIPGGGGGGGGYPSIAFPKRTSTPKIAGDIGGTALSTLALTASRQYFIPLVVPRDVTLTGLRISVTTASAGAANLGIYANTQSGGNDVPGARIAQITATLDTGTTGDKTGSFSSSVTLTAGTLYWVSAIGSAAATIRALAVASVQTALGRQVNNTGAITHLFASGSGSTLPDPAPSSLSDGTGVCPAIYLVE
jgi:hypothetical protein